jgi:hypothetical protein
MNRPIALIAIASGVLLIAVGFDAVMKENRYKAAAKRLEELLYARSDQREDGREPRFSFLHKMSTQGEVSLDSLRDSVPEDEIVPEKPYESVARSSDKFVMPAPPKRANTDDLPQGSGTQKDPWRGLQHALDQLGPGDRLVVLAGRYHGPLIIGRRSGTSDSPIEVLFTKDAILVGASEAGTCDTPVLQAEGGHWHLFDLTLTPQFCPSGLRVVEPAKHVDLFSPHIYGGVGMGVVVESGASEVNIFEPHLHHLANLEGRDSERKQQIRAEGLTPEDSHVPALSGPLGGVTVRGGKIHNHFGPILVLFDSLGRALQPELAAKQLDDWGVSVVFADEQMPWW